MKNLDDPNTGQPKTMSIVYNLVMMVVYIGVGILFCEQFFSIDNPTISYCVGGLLIAYGIWRGIRLYINYKSKR